MAAVESVEGAETVIMAWASCGLLGVLRAALRCTPAHQTHTCMHAAAGRAQLMTKGDSRGVRLGASESQASHRSCMSVHLQQAACQQWSGLESSKNHGYMRLYFLTVDPNRSASACSLPPFHLQLTQRSLQAEYNAARFGLQPYMTCGFGQYLHALMFKL